MLHLYSSNFSRRIDNQSFTTYQQYARPGEPPQPAPQRPRVDAEAHRRPRRVHHRPRAAPQHRAVYEG